MADLSILIYVAILLADCDPNWRVKLERGFLGVIKDLFLNDKNHQINFLAQWVTV